MVLNVPKLGKSKIWGRGYTTIPFAVRKILDLDNGDELEWLLTTKGNITIKKIKKVQK